MTGDKGTGDQPNPWRTAAQLSTIGIEMALTVFVGFGLGYFADSRLHTLPWFSLAGTLLGVVAGFWQTIRTIERSAKNP